jgi:hypothetical protein
MTCVAVATGALPLQALTPRAELLRLVPEDVGFCLVVQNLREHSAAFQGSAFLEQFRASPLGQAVQDAPEYRKLVELDAHLRRYLDVSWARLRDDILGDTVILAYRPGPPGALDQEQDLFLVRARDPQLLGTLAERLNAAQKESGEILDLETRTYHGVPYVRRVERKRDHYYFLRDGVLAFSSREPMLRQVIDRERQQSEREQPVLVRNLRRVESEQALATLWVNPRAFDGEIERKGIGARGTEAVVHKAVLAYWKSLDGIAVVASLHEQDIELRLTLLAREAQLPAPARKVFSAPGKPSDLWNRVPARALVAVAGRLETAEVTDFVDTFLTEEARKSLKEAMDRGPEAALGKDVVQQVLASVGPDWGIFVAAPAAADKDWFPEVTVALRVRSGGPNASADRTILAALQGAAVLAVLAYNSSHPDAITLRNITEGPVEIHYLSGAREFPPGLQPAFALKGDYLLLASSPDTVRHFAETGAVKKPELTSGEMPWVQLFVQQVSGFLKERRDSLAAYVAEKHLVPKEEVSRRLDDLAAHLQFLDRMTLTQRSQPGRFSLVLRLRTSASLRK